MVLIKGEILMGLMVMCVGTLLHIVAMCTKEWSGCTDCVTDGKVTHSLEVGLWKFCMTWTPERHDKLRGFFCLATNKEDLERLFSRDNVLDVNVRGITMAAVFTILGAISAGAACAVTVAMVILAALDKTKRKFEQYFPMAVMCFAVVACIFILMGTVVWAALGQADFNDAMVHVNMTALYERCKENTTSECKQSRPPHRWILHQDASLGLGYSYALTLLGAVMLVVGGTLIQETKNSVGHRVTFQNNNQPPVDVFPATSANTVD